MGEKGVENFGLDEIARYLNKDVRYCWMMWREFIKLLERRGVQGAYDFEMSMYPCVMDIEYEGFPVDTTRMAEVKKDLLSKIAAIEDEAWTRAGAQYPLSKPDYKRWILFGEGGQVSKKNLKTLNLPVLRRTNIAVLVEQLEVLVKATTHYSGEIQCFFASMPAAKLVSGLPGAKSGTTLASVWAEIGDAPGRWQSFRHLQAQAGSVPLTKESGKVRVVHFRFSCNKRLRHAVYWLAFTSLNQSEWAKVYYREQRSKGHTHHQAIRALGAKWLKIIFVLGKTINRMMRITTWPTSPDRECARRREKKKKRT